MINNTLNATRKLGFWTMDFVKGEAIKKAYKEIKEINGLDSRDPKIHVHQKRAFNDLKKFADETTEFYKGMKDLPLSEFPLINKNTIRDNLKAFRSNNYNDADLIEMVTSGSTGTPFTSYQNLEKKRRVQAETIYFWEKAGYKVGKRIIYLTEGMDRASKTRLSQWVQNVHVLDIENEDDERIAFLIQEIKEITKNHEALLIAYGSTFDVVKNYLKKEGLDTVKGSRISGIVSTADMLHDDTREILTKAYNCPVVSRYSNQENGIIGQDKFLKNVFILNEANYIIEIFDIDKDEPIPDGEVGRVVITDLYNKAMPMIRYDTGDVGALSYVKINGRKKRALSNFGGRKIETIFDASGRKIAHGDLLIAFWNYPSIRQFQFIQETKDTYTAKINVDEDFPYLKDLEKDIKQLAGPQAHVTVEKVDEIPVMSSGKRKYVVNKTLL
jgi:phenylacetate-CoA ligase